MEQFEKILEDATRAIAQNYIFLPIHGSAGFKYRERVYCYELYHQMRCLWPKPNETRYCLNGEVDKRAHPYFAAMKKKPIPDLLVHVPGEGRNHAIIKVKPAKATKTGIRKDLETLSIFMNEIGYQRGLYLIFGAQQDVQSTANKIQKCMSETQLPEIKIWLHAHGDQARRFA